MGQANQIELYQSVLEKLSAIPVQELDYTQRIGLKFVRMQIELEKLLNRKVDLVSEKGISKYIKPIVDQEKKLIYAR